MTPLSQKMIDLMIRQFAPKTHQIYLRAVTSLSMLISVQNLPGFWGKQR